MVAEVAAETVYVVDNDASVRSALERLFRSSGFRVEAFDSSAAFLAHGLDGYPCCAVLDLRMPRMDGLAVQARLREAGRRVPVVFLTGLGDEATRAEAMRMGAIDFIEKPADSEALVAVVRRALEASRTDERAG